MKVNRKDLLNALTAVKPGLAQKDIIEQMTHFIFTGNNIVAYNDRTCVYCPFETDFECSVSSADFYKIISKISAEEIDLSLKGSNLVIKSKRTTAKMSILIEDEITEMLKSLEKETGVTMKKVPQDFLEGIFLCMFSASKEQTKGTLVCINITGSTLISSDNVRASMYEMDSKMDDFKLPAYSVPSLNDLAVTKYGLSDNWLHFMNKDGIRISVRQLIGDFPDYVRMLKVEGPKVRLPKELKDTLETVSIMSPGEIVTDKMVDIEIMNDLITCRTKKDRGSIERTIDIKYKKDPVRFKTNPVLLSQVLDSATRMTIGKGALLFESKKFKHVLATIA